jgi:hypothetical protein
LHPKKLVYEQGKLVGRTRRHGCDAPMTHQLRPTTGRSVTLLEHAYDSLGVAYVDCD